MPVLQGNSGFYKGVNMDNRSINETGYQLFKAVLNNDLKYVKDTLNSEPELVNLTDHCDYRLERELGGEWSVGRGSFGRYEDNTLFNFALSMERTEIALEILEKSAFMSDPNQKNDKGISPLEMIHMIHGEFLLTYKRGELDLLKILSDKEQSQAAKHVIELINTFLKVLRKYNKPGEIQTDLQRAIYQGLRLNALPEVSLYYIDEIHLLSQETEYSGADAIKFCIFNYMEGVVFNSFLFDLEKLKNTRQNKNDPSVAASLNQGITLNENLKATYTNQADRVKNFIVSLRDNPSLRDYLVEAFKGPLIIEKYIAILTPNDPILKEKDPAIFYLFKKINNPKLRKFLNDKDQIIDTVSTLLASIPGILALKNKDGVTVEAMWKKTQEELHSPSVVLETSVNVDATTKEIDEKTSEKFIACEKALQDFINTPIYKKISLFQSTPDQDIKQAKTYQDLLQVKTPLAKLAVMQALLNTNTPGLSRAIALSLGHFSNNEKSDLKAAKEELTKLIKEECERKGISTKDFAKYPALINKKLNVDIKLAPFNEFYKWDLDINKIPTRPIPSQTTPASEQKQSLGPENLSPANSSKEKVEGKIAEFEFRGQHSGAPFKGARSCTSISLITAARLLRMEKDEFFNTFNPNMKTSKEKQNANDVLTGCVLAGYDLNAAISGSYLDVVSRKDITDVMSKIDRLEKNIGGIKELALLEGCQVRIHDSEFAKEAFPMTLKDFREALIADTAKPKPEGICFIATAAGHTTAFFSRKDKAGKEFFFVSDARDTLFGGKLEVFNNFDTAYARMLEKWKSHNQDYVSISAFTTKELLAKENIPTNETSHQKKTM